MQSSFAPTTQQSASLVSLIKDAHTVLLSQSDLSPNNRLICDTIKDLREALILPYDQEVTENVTKDKSIIEIKPSLQMMLAIIEYEEELYLSNNILKNNDFTNDTDHLDFSYYEKMISKEINLVQKNPFCSNISQNSNVVFVGSGPLPLSSIMIAQETGAHIIGIDTERDSCIQARHLISEFGLSNNLEILQQDGRKFDFYHSDMVFIASLVPDKEGVMERIYQTCNPNNPPTIMTRTVEGLRTILYAPVDEERCETMGLSVIGTTDISDETIHTTLVGALDQELLQQKNQRHHLQVHPYTATELAPAA